MEPNEVQKAMKELRAKRDEINRQLKSIADACTHEGTLVPIVGSRTGLLAWCKACKRHLKANP